jgi:hypothetical protein
MINTKIIIQKIKLLLYLILSTLNHCELNPKLNINGAFISPFIGGSTLALNGSTLTGEVALDGTTTTIPLSRKVVTTKSILLCSYRYGGNSVSYSSTCNLSSAGDSLVVKTGSFYSGTYVRYTVIEFKTGVSVLRGEIDISNLSYGKNLEFSEPIDLKKNFLIFETRVLANNNPPTEHGRLFKGSFVSNTKLEFRREAISPAVQIIYQIIAMNGVNIYQGEVSIANGSSHTTAKIDQINLTNSILLTSLNANSDTVDIEDNYLVRSNFLTNSSIDFSRMGAVGGLDINYFVIEFLTGPRVQTGTVNISSNDSSSTFTLPSPLKDLNSTFLLFSNDINSNSIGDMDLSYFTGTVSNVGQESKITFERTRAGGSSNLSYFLIDFYRQ